MASNGTTDAPTRDEERPESLTFTLQVVSPSVGVSMPLVFPQLPATTSIKELKAKIRAVLPSQPSDENQRLIHRGRMLGNEAETMSNIFGRDTLQNPQSQTLHLVLRPTATDNPSTQPGTSLPVPPTPAELPPTGLPPLPLLLRTNHPAPRAQTIPPHQQHHFLGAEEQHINHAEERSAILRHQLARLQQETERLNNSVSSMEQRALAMATERGVPSIQDLITQQQRERAAEGRFGVQDNSTTFSGRSSPMGPEHGYAVPGNAPGPNGERIAMHARGAVPHPFQSNPNVLPEDMLAMLGNHMNPEDARAMRERNMIPNLQSEVPAPSPNHNQASQSENVAPQNGGLPQSIRSTARQWPPQNPMGNFTTTDGRTQNVVTYVQEQIGPNGERTVVQHQVVNGHPVQSGHVLANGARYTHNPIPELMAHMQAHIRAARSPHRAPGYGAGNMERSASDPAMGNSSAVRAIPTAATGTNTPTGHQSFLQAQPSSGNVSSNTAPLRNPSGEPTVYLLSSPSGPRALLVTNQETFYSRSAPPARRTNYAVAPGNEYQLPEYRNRPGRGGRRANRQERANADANANGNRPIIAPHANPEAGAMAARVVPLLWLLVRLVGFVWFFTSGNPSWSRWLMISSLAFAVFLFNTGIFNGIANDLWAPVRAHLEALIPLAGPDAALIPAQNAAPIPQVGPTPANAAPRRGELDPHQYAARLVEQRRQQNGWFMAHVRRVEHSFLLFVASLIPGVGERHIAAREAEANERQRIIDAAAAAAEAEAAANAETENAGEEDAGVQEGQEPAVEGEAAQPQVAPLIDV